MHPAGAASLEQIQVAWKLVMLPVTVFQYRALGDPGPSLLLEIEAKKASNIFAVSTSPFVG